jgi:endonuclease III related protein
MHVGVGINNCLEPSREDLLKLYRQLWGFFGHRKWWPAESPFEVCVGAVLTQNTSWKNVEKAIQNLRAASALDPKAIHEMNRSELATLLRPSGYYNVKTDRLKSFVRHLMKEHSGDLESFFELPLERLRADLLGIHGVGKETADSIVLYAAAKPIFVVDAYTKRVLLRHGCISEADDYDSIQALFHSLLPSDLELFKDFHAQFVAVGNHFCRKTSKCEQCPLLNFRCGSNDNET